MSENSLRVRVLGSSAGGGLPQWNCGCPQCHAARSDQAHTPPRTQSSIAVSADGVRWVLLNASPDVRTQLAQWPEAAPPPGYTRHTPIAASVLSNADLDHCLGLLILREGGAPAIYATDAALEALEQGLGVLSALRSYGPVVTHALALDQEISVRDREGRDTGVWITPFAVASKVPPYASAKGLGQTRGDLDGDAIGLLVRTQTSATLAYVPALRVLDARLAGYLSRAHTLLVDGTFFGADELTKTGVTTRDAYAMGHAPLSGPDGILAYLQHFPDASRWLIHINNSNPIVCSHSEECALVHEANVGITYDGLSLTL
ncbi:MAG: MBL fold metallo-hydrolase [Deltaproteobacteria bacterium]|nr:MBL fold metallo-hydrolase [Deltaproteobacteria bacterium]